MVLLILLRNAGLWAFSISWWTFALAFHLLAFRRTPDAWFVRSTRWWAGTALRILGVEVVTENASTVEFAAPRVMICNHQSGLDFVWASRWAPPRPLVIGKKEVIFVPMINVIWWGLRFIRIDRSNHQAALEALAGVASLIRRESRTLVVAPEGTRSRDGSMLPFKKGAFHIAMQAGVPIHPIVMAGAFECLPRGSMLVKPGKLRLRFLEPVSTAGWTPETLDTHVAQVRDRMVRTFEELNKRR